MNFGLLLSSLPHIEASRAHYDDLLTLTDSEVRTFSECVRARKHSVAEHRSAGTETRDKSSGKRPLTLQHLIWTSGNEEKLR